MSKESDTLKEPLLGAAHEVDSHPPSEKKSTQQEQDGINQLPPAEGYSPPCLQEDAESEKSSEYGASPRSGGRFDFGKSESDLSELDEETPSPDGSPSQIAAAAAEALLKATLEGHPPAPTSQEGGAPKPAASALLAPASPPTVPTSPEVAVSTPAALNNDQTIDDFVTAMAQGTAADFGKNQLNKLIGTITTSRKSLEEKLQNIITIFKSLLSSEGIVPPEGVSLDNLNLDNAKKNPEQAKEIIGQLLLSTGIPEKNKKLLQENADKLKEKLDSLLTIQNRLEVAEKRKKLLSENEEKKLKLLSILAKKTHKKQELIRQALLSYGFDETDFQFVLSAILSGDLRISDILDRGRWYEQPLYKIYRLACFKNPFKQLSKEEVLQVAKNDGETRSQWWMHYAGGGTLATVKIITSAALAGSFAYTLMTLLIPGILSFIGWPVAIPFWATIAVISYLAISNGWVTAKSRGKTMVNSLAFAPKKQDLEADLENEKWLPRYLSKITFGVITLLGCVAAGGTAWTGLVGFIAAVGLAALIANPWFLVLIGALSLISAFSFYSFQASGIESNCFKFIKMFKEIIKEGGLKGTLKGFGFFLISALFLSVYAFFTWFTAGLGIQGLGAQFLPAGSDVAASALAYIATFSTMWVNMFSQVVKVFNPQTYIDFRKSFSSQEATHQVPYKDLSLKEKFFRILDHINRALDIISLPGNEVSYSISGGFKCGLQNEALLGGENAPNHWVGLVAGTIIAVVLFLVSFAFTWPNVLENSKEPGKAPKPAGNSAAEAAQEASTPAETPAKAAARGLAAEAAAKVEEKQTAVVTVVAPPKKASNDGGVYGGVYRAVAGSSSFFTPAADAAIKADPWAAVGGGCSRSPLIGEQTVVPALTCGAP